MVTTSLAIPVEVALCWRTFVSGPRYDLRGGRRSREKGRYKVPASDLLSGEMWHLRLLRVAIGESESQHSDWPRGASDRW